jgi:hypothetical protein
MLQPKYSLKSIELKAVWTRGGAAEEKPEHIVLSPEAVLKILRQISNEDCEALG